MTWYSFVSGYTMGEILPDFNQDEIRQEPMVFSADYDFAHKNGGPLTRSFLNRLSTAYNWIIDSKTVMLFDGFYPCIPGWHHDDVPRSAPNGQPNYDSLEYKASHVMAIWGNYSRTEFITSRVTLPKIKEGTVYSKWSQMLDDMIASGVAEVQTIPAARMIYFDWRDFHRGMPATSSGWRFFIRATRNTQRKFFNEVRTQVQIYLSAVDAGW